MKTQLITAIFLLIIVNFTGCKNHSTNQVQDFDNLKNSTWQFVAFESDDTSITVEKADTILLSFQQNQVIYGKSRGLCSNEYFGYYFLGECNLIRFDSLSSSKALCPHSMYWEYYDKLSTVISFKLESSQLFLNCGDTKEKLLFERIR